MQCRLPHAEKVAALLKARNEIDTVLARHYGFTEEELDFIVNYDIKYRLGRDVESAEE